MGSGELLSRDLAFLLKDEGRPMTLRRVTQGTYDPATGSAPAGSTLNYNARGRLGNYRDSIVDGQLIKKEDRRCTIVFNDAAVVPTVTDVLIVGTDTYQIINTQERELGGTVIGWTMQVRS